MKTLLKKMFVPFLTAMCLIVSIFFHTSCSYRSNYKYDQDKSEIMSIEIVEAYYDRETQNGFQKSLVTVDDVNLFLEGLEKIKYKMYVGSSPKGVVKKSLAVKITYKNQEYEVFDYCGKDSYKKDAGYCGQISGCYDKEAFYEYLFKYLDNVEDAHFNFMYDASEITDIEIVKSTIQSDTSVACETLAVIEDKEQFVLELNKVKYIYTNDEFLDDMNSLDDQSIAIKVTYQDGDYEVFSHNHRDEVNVFSNGNVLSRPATYTGTFDYEDFYFLISKYLGYTITT